MAFARLLSSWPLFTASPDAVPAATLVILSPPTFKLVPLLVNVVVFAPVPITTCGVVTLVNVGAALVATLKVVEPSAAIVGVTTILLPAVTVVLTALIASSMVFLLVPPILVGAV